MPVQSDVRYRVALNRIGYAESLLEDQKYDEAWKVLQGALADAQARGIASAGLFWLVGVVADFRRDWGTALAFLQQAIKLDALNVRYWQSFGVVVGRIKEALLSDATPWEAPAKATLMEHLVAAGEVDADANLAYARHLAAVGRHADAMRILDALTFLYPHRSDALLLAASVARALGTPERAERVVSEPLAFERPGEEVSFILPQAQA